jgi:zinc/manganese transport system substrate-binding protein
MKRIPWIAKVILVATLPLATRRTHAAEIEVVAATPDLGAIARAVGGDRAAVKSIARGTEDPHFVDAKPSHVVSLNHADALVEGGAQLEIGWLPKLVESARNPRIATGAPGRILANEGVALLEVPTGPIDRSMGDVHPGGNPHYLLDPRNGVIVARTIATHLAVADPGGAETYRRNADAFVADLKNRIVGWDSRLAALRGSKAVEYHKLFEYLSRWAGLDVVAQVEPKPGIPPNPAHVAALEEQIRSQKIPLLLAATYNPEDVTKEIADRTGIQVARIPTSVGDGDGTDTYPDLIERIVTALERAHAAAAVTTPSSAAAGEVSR